MAEATVTERPATDPATEAEATGATDGVLDTEHAADPAAEVQTEEATATAVTEPDPHAVALEAAREAALEEGRELARAELEEERRRARDTESRRQLKEHLPNTIRAMDEELAGLGVVDMNDPANRQKALKYLNSFNLKAQEAILAPFEDAVQELIPAAVRDDFNRAADGKPAADFQRTFAEFMAEHDPAIRNKVLKGLKLDDLEKANPSLKAALAARDSAQYDKGRAKGRTDPAGESAGEERTSSSTGYKTKMEARALRVQGRIDNDELRRALANPNLPD